MFVLETEVSYPPNAQMRLAASFVRFLREVRNSPPGLCNCSDCSHTDRLRGFWSQYSKMLTSRNMSADNRFATLCHRISNYRVTWCEVCDNIIWQGLAHDVGALVCANCYPQFHYCNRCQGWFHDDDAGEHQHEEELRYSKCKAPHEAFTFPARCLDREIQNDERVTVTLPSGHISNAGLDSIFRYVYAELGDSNLYYALQDSEIGTEWVTRAGNFTKRVAKLCLQNGVKLTPTLLTEIGNLARQNTSTTSEFHVEVTRNFNLGAEAFLNAGSCWFSDYWQSLCIFKQHGGLALRTFTPYGHVTGRAWVLPLDSALTPTHETDTDAYVLFNVYGLPQYEAPHILAQMTGKTYRKVEFNPGRQMYVNSDVGFLIASEQICRSTTSVTPYMQRTCRCPYGR